MSKEFPSSADSAGARPTSRVRRLIVWAWLEVTAIAGNWRGQVGQLGRYLWAQLQPQPQAVAAAPLHQKMALGGIVLLVILGGAGTWLYSAWGTPAGLTAPAADFMQVCKTGTPEQLKARIAKGADVNAKYQGAYTPLMIAATYNPNSSMITALVQAGAEVTARDEAGNTPLIYAASFNPKPEVMAALVKAGAKVNAKDQQGWTPLMRAAKKNWNPKVIVGLIQAGAEVNTQDKNGWTPLLFAVGDNNPEVLAALIKAGANVNAKNGEGRTPLMQAVLNNRNPEVIGTLLKAGAEVNAKDGDGKTALDDAQLVSNTRVVKLLIKAGGR